MFVEALVRLLVAEHKNKPICGKVLALGKQTVAISLEKIIEIFKDYECSVNPNVDLNDLKTDTTTRIRDNKSLDDEAFFQLFGDIDYQTMDVSSYESATIIHNLNDPIPEELEGQFDFIIDGGTFDHIFDIKTAFANVAKLLKPGGRIFQWNAASNYANAGYLSFSADFFYDFYALNKFADCKTYFARSYYMGAQNWCLYQFTPGKQSSRYDPLKQSYFFTMVIVLAQKGLDSTFDRMPIQLQYRDADLLEEYQKNIEQFDLNSQKFAIKTIPLKKAEIPLRYKLLHVLEPKPCSSSYPCVGWI